MTRRTQAYVGANAGVTADGSVIVTADTTETVDSFSVAGTGGGEFTLGLTAGVSAMTATLSTSTGRRRPRV